VAAADKLLQLRALQRAELRLLKRKRLQRRRLTLILS